ncbi:MAG: LysR family transcriptional regulator [Acidobacteria bacterium]|nr:LysR family transcriptional regulator [Acidobacteriota bacterium]
MNTDQLRAFEAVVRLGSFAAAGAELHKVTSAISYNIKTLEDELGLSLFSRDGYRAELTQEGRLLLGKSRSLLNGFRSLHDLAQEIVSGAEAMVRLDITPIWNVAAIAHPLREFQLRFPATQLVYGSEVFGGEALVLEQAADIAISDVIDRDNRLDRVWIGTVDFIPVAAPHHPLATLNTIDETELSACIQIVVSSKSARWKDVSLGVALGAKIWRVPDLFTKRQFLCDGLGWGNMPAPMVADDLEQGRLVRLTMDALAESAQMMLVRSRDRSLGPAGRFLWQSILQTLKAD